MPPHITDVQRPQSTKNSTHVGASIIVNDMFWNPGMLIVESGIHNPQSKKAIATVATVESCARLENLEPNDPPTRRPTSINNQYIPTSEPAAEGFIPLPGFLTSL